jgi:hypothetical protein
MPQKRKGNVVQQLVDMVDLEFFIPGRSDIVDEELEFDEEASKATQASKEFFTDLFTWLVNYRSNQLDVQEGGYIKRKYTWEIDETKDIASAFMEDLYKRYMGKPIPEKK